ncbi:unnamed protein product [Larinioides sclopetarius]|uniref:Uncharacterized protein n=1 Tax=Larinioides sclopetarius TaxID=280406 RepID=A0AAV2AX82_9ARAC
MTVLSRRLLFPVHPRRYRCHRRTPFRFLYCYIHDFRKKLHRLLFWNRHSKEVRIEITKKNNLKQNKNNTTEIGEVNDAFQDMDLKTSHQENATKDATPVYITDPVKKYIIERPAWKKILFFICGVSKQTSAADSEEQFSAEEEATSAAEGITEKPLWRRICDANAILLIAVCSFIWGYFA